MGLATSNSLRSLCSSFYFFLLFSFSFLLSLYFSPPIFHYRSSTFTFIPYKIDRTGLTSLSAQLIYHIGPPGNSTSHANPWLANQPHVGGLFVFLIWEVFSNLSLCEGAPESITQCLNFSSSISIVNWEVFSSVWYLRFSFLSSIVILINCKILATYRLPTCRGVV